MDKQKQIEEMEKDIAIRMAMAKGVAGSMNNGVEGWLAEYLIEKGWAKIPEGAVVLTGMETEQRFEDLMVAFDEMGFMPNTTHPFPEEYVETWKQRLIFVFGQLRKETAEKFAERLKELVADRNCNEDYEWEDVQVDGQIFIECVDEICKEIKEGENENS